MDRNATKRAREIKIKEVPPPPSASSTMDFQKPDPNLHDVVLVVEEEEFYCSKANLARHSQYFYSMFFNDFVEKNKKRVELKIPGQPKHFRMFLETIHGLKVIRDKNVENILVLADLFQAGAATEQCVEFLKRKSRMHRKEKFELAEMYGLEDLKKSIIYDCDDAHDLNKLIPEQLMSLDHTTMGHILQRNFEVQGFRDNSNGQDFKRHLVRAAEETRVSFRDRYGPRMDGRHRRIPSAEVREHHAVMRKNRRKQRRRVLRERGDSPAVSSSSSED